MTTKLLFMLVFFSFSAFASEEFKPLPPKKMAWKFQGIFGYFDKQSIQRGYQVYREICSACHSMNKLYFRNLTEIGFSKEEVKTLANSYKILDGPNDQGEIYERPGIASDRFVVPFANKEQGMFQHGGVAPPDLSLIVKARHDGSNYIYSLLTGYTGETEGLLHINPYFSTGKLLMGMHLVDNTITYNDGTPSTAENMAYDVVNFLHWAAEPEMEIRKKLGLKVVIFCIILTTLFYFYNRKLWQRLYKSNKKFTSKSK